MKTYLPSKFLVEQDTEWCIQCQVWVSQCIFDTHYYDAEEICRLIRETLKKGGSSGK